MGDRIILKKEGGIIQYTLFDKRWYQIPELEKALPSVTWILDEGYPKGIGFQIWLANKVRDWEHSREIAGAAGDRGTNVHWLCEQSMKGIPIDYDALLEDGRGITHEEYSYFLSFVNFVKFYRPVILAVEQTVWNEKEGYAGTVDILCLLDGSKFNSKSSRSVRCIIDLKTSSAVYRTLELQQAAYERCYQPGEIDKVFLLQLTTKWNNKNGGYKLHEVTDLDGAWKSFLAAKTLWDDVNREASPDIHSVPESVTLWNMYQGEEETPFTPSAEKPQQVKQPETPAPLFDGGNGQTEDLF